MAAVVPRYEEWLRPELVGEVGAAAGDPPQVAELRSDAFEAFRILALEPNPLYRKYGYFAGVDLRGLDPLATGPAVAVPPASAERLQIVHDASGTRVQLPTALRAAGVRIETLREAWSDGPVGTLPFLRGAEQPPDRLSALGLTLLNRGYRLTIPDRCSATVQVHDITVLSRPHEALSVRRSVSVGEEGRLLMTEELFSTPDVFPDQRLSASSVDIDLKARSEAALLSLHAPDPRAIGLYQRHATVGAQAKHSWIWNGFGGFRTKVRNQTVLEGEGSATDDLQSFFGAEQQAYDSSVNIVHVGTNTHGQSITRGVFRDEARGMSRGLVRIEPGARGTLSYISEHAMLLSPGTRSDTIPVLEILCPDVKATHSTSVAPVDPEKVFYLESRGMRRPDAIRMIGEGFLSHVLDRAPIAHLREILYPALANRWENKVLWWDPNDLPSLPDLAFAGNETTTDWRFDFKLR
jgi:Fe-S cluster assembly protein SufD